MILNDTEERWRDIIGKCQHLSILPTEHLLHVSIARQQLLHFRNAKPVLALPVSTSRKPPSCTENSLGTPTGLHRICEKIGEGQPLGMVFKARQPTGYCHWECPVEERTQNLITTRILRLRGLEPGHNCGPGHDTFDRFVYIHGTNQKDRIGTPNSHGCILLEDASMLALHDAIPPDSLVFIAL